MNAIVTSGFQMPASLALSVPGAPQNPTAVGGNAQATISWGAAASPLTPVTKYRVYVLPGNLYFDTTNLSITITGLTNGQTYTFAVAASNIMGQGPAASSNPVTPNNGVGAPAAPTNAVASLDPAASNAIDVFFNGPDARSISPLTQYTAQLYVSGVATGSPVSVSRNPTTGAISCYIHFTGVAPGTYTVAVTATNANGTSPSSAMSNSVTTSAPIDYYISQGAGSITTSPQNTAWSSFTGQGTNYADPAQGYNGQANSISIAPGGLALPFYKNIWSNFVANGNFYTDPFAHITMLIFGTNLAHNIDLSFRYAGFCFGTVSSGAQNTFTDNSQQFVTNGWSTLATASNGSFQNKGGNYAGNLTTSSNTSNVVTVTGSGGHNWSADAMWMVSIGDTDFPNGATSPAPIASGITTYTIAQFNSSGVQTGSATTLQNGFWNLVHVPMSVMNNQTAPTNNVKEFYYPHAIQEFRIANSSSNSTIYITNFGLLVN